MLELTFGMFQKLFAAMASRLQIDFVQQTVDTFLEIFTPDQILTLTAPESVAGAGVEMFLGIVGYFVRDRGKVSSLNFIS